MGEHGLSVCAFACVHVRVHVCMCVCVCMYVYERGNMMEESLTSREFFYSNVKKVNVKKERKKSSKTFLSKAILLFSKDLFLSLFCSPLIERLIKEKRENDQLTSEELVWKKQRQVFR